MGRRFRPLVATLALLLPAIPAIPAIADDTGVAQSLHDVRREGRKLCLEGHFHDGHSSGMASQKGAEAEAIKAWEEFTNWEYGTDWASWSKAASRRLTCSNTGVSWGCHAEARACKDAAPNGRRATGRK